MPQMYVGLTRWQHTPADIERMRSDHAVGTDEFAERVSALRQNPPTATCRVLGAYAIGSPDLLSIMVVEA